VILNLHNFHDVAGIAVSLNNLSSLAIAQGEHFRAAQLQGAVRSKLAEIGSVLEDMEEVWFQDNRKKLIAHLGEAEYQIAFEAGHSLGIDEAVELALGYN